jgi:glycosyltransferase involved in cell wall biosynthesis
MSIGVPIVGLATTEMATLLENGRSGYVATDLDRLTAAMQSLLRDPVKARELGANARRTARVRFSIETFARAWQQTIVEVVKPSIRQPI